MGQCASKRLLEGDLLLWYEGQSKLLPSRSILYYKLRSHAKKLVRNNGNLHLAAVASTGNPLLINDEGSWKNLLISKDSSILVIIVWKDEPLRNLKFGLTEHSAEDKKNQNVLSGFKKYLYCIEVFDEHFLDFINRLSFCLIRTYRLQSVVEIFMILMSPYVDKILPSTPFLTLDSELSRNMPGCQADLHLMWELLIGDTKDIVWQFEVVDKNLDILLAKHQHTEIEVSQDHSIDFVALKRAENYMKYHRAKTKIQDYNESTELFLRRIQQILKSKSTEKRMMMDRITRIISLGEATETSQVSWMFGISDYISMPRDYRFL